MTLSWTLLLLAALTATASAAKSRVVMDASGSLGINAVPQSLTSESLVAIISNPAVTSSLSPSEDSLLCLVEGDPPLLSCRGPTLDMKSADPKCVAIGLCSLTASAIVVDGITTGDVEAGLLNSRHAVTLSAIFRTRMVLGADRGKQALMLYATGAGSAALEKEMKGELKTLFLAASAEAKDSVAFDDAYDLHMVFSESQSATEVSLKQAEMVHRKASTLYLLRISIVCIAASIIRQSSRPVIGKTQLPSAHRASGGEWQDGRIQNQFRCVGSTADSQRNCSSGGCILQTSTICESQACSLEEPCSTWVADR